MASASINATTNAAAPDVTVKYFEPYEFLETQPALYYTLIITLVIAAFVGSCGNIFILVAIATQRDLHTVESVFIVNLACCDLYVTLVADPLSIVAKTLGWRFFSDFPGFCRAVGSICTISCVGSLMTLSAMSCNRYILICYRHLYHRLFTIRNSVIMCCCFYLVGFVLVALNFFGVGNHSFDHKSLECFWDRMADHDYTIVFSVVVIMIPITVTGLAYMRLFLHVRQSRQKVHSHGKINPKPSTSSSPTQPPFRADRVMPNTSRTDRTADMQLKDFNSVEHTVQPQDSNPTEGEDGSVKNMRLGTKKPSIENGSPQAEMQQNAPQRKQSEKPNAGGGAGGEGGGSDPTSKLARSLFIIYLVFSACWMPFSLLIALDANDTFAHEVHVTVVVWAHLHPSVNWLIYYHTNRKFHTAFRKLLRLDK